MTQSRSRSVRIALVQMHCSEDVSDNLSRALARLDAWTERTVIVALRDDRGRYRLAY